MGPPSVRLKDEKAAVSKPVFQVAGACCQSTSPAKIEPMSRRGK